MRVELSLLSPKDRSIKGRSIKQRIYAWWHSRRPVIPRIRGWRMAKRQSHILASVRRRMYPRQMFEVRLTRSGLFSSLPVTVHRVLECFTRGKLHRFRGRDTNLLARSRVTSDTCGTFALRE